MRFAFLSDKFYEDYPANRYPEIEQKRNRPYVVVFITIGERIFAIPMRSHIRHPHRTYQTKRQISSFCILL